jgi:hypothetical protein
MMDGLSAEGRELLSLSPSSEHIADALQGIERAIAEMQWDRRRWILSAHVKRFSGLRTQRQLSRGSLSARHDLRPILEALRRD